MHVSCSLSVYFFPPFFLKTGYLSKSRVCTINGLKPTDFDKLLFCFWMGCVLINSLLLPLLSWNPLHSLTSLEHLWRNWFFRMTLFPSLYHLLVYVTNQSPNLFVSTLLFTRTKESVSRSHKFWQCRQGLDCYLLSHFAGGMDWNHVLCPRCSLLLGLDLLRPTHCGQYLVSQETLSIQ